MVGRTLALVAMSALALTWSPVPAARAQAAPIAWDFNDGLQGWVVAGGLGTVAWAADGTPTFVTPSVPVGSPAPSAWSYPNSLNYNDGVNYDPNPDGNPSSPGDQGPGNGGTATSPPITVTTPQNIGFYCAYDTELAADDIGIFPSPPWGAGPYNVNICDLRFVRVRNSQGQIVWQRQFIAPDGDNPPAWGPQPAGIAFEDCGPRGFWHTHYFQLDPLWSPMTIEFRFETGQNDLDGGPGADDPVANQHSGWFIDDISLNLSAPSPPGGSGEGGADRDNFNSDAGGGGGGLCGAGASGSAFMLLACLGAAATILRRR